MEGARRFLVPLLLVVSGCHGAPEPEYPTYASAPTPYLARPTGGDTFDAYLVAAQEAEAAVQNLNYRPLARTFFTPKQRETLLRELAPALRRIDAARGPCDFRYVPVLPGDPLPGRAAWRLIGRAMRWRIDDDLTGNSAQNAVSHAVTAFRFAADLCGGGPADRTLGVEIAEDVRVALLSTLPRLDPGGLRKLATGVKEALKRRPSLEATLKHGDTDMALALQTLQDAYRANRYDRFDTVLGKDARDLAGLPDLHGAKRAAFFQGLNETRDVLSRAWHHAAALPATRRAEVLKVKLKGDKAAKTFARHFFLIGRPLLAIDDRSLARLRLLILEAELRRVVRLGHSAPRSLDAVRPPWATDPYNGRTFGYQPDGAEFRVYSVGANLKDDLGDTDDAGLAPDIRTVVP